MQTKAEARRELVGRLANKARGSLVRFTTWTHESYKPEGFHREVGRLLDELVLEGKHRRLMIFAPPQHGKTELVSVRLPVFALGHHPDWPIILTSYDAALAHRNSRHARAVLESQLYQRVFPDVRTGLSRAVQIWELEGARGQVVAAGVGGPITGHGAMLAVIDDPYKNWEQAHSEAYRRKVWDWWKSTFRTRVWEGGSIVLIMTRWHVDDLAGKLLSLEPDVWEAVNFEALCENVDEDPLRRAYGEPLCPLRFSRESLLATKKAVGEYTWQAEYMGSPVRLEGNLAERAWFAEILEQSPAQVEDRVRAWDLAATAKEAAKGDPDYTVGTRMSRSEGKYVVEHVIREQLGPGAILPLIKATAARDGRNVRIFIEQEPGASGKIQKHDFIRALDGYVVDIEPARGDKVSRAMPFLSQAKGGNVALVRGSWNEAWLDEICAVPSAPHFDQWDSVVHAYNTLAIGLREVVEIPSWFGGEPEILTKREELAMIHSDSELHRRWAKKNFCPECYEQHQHS